VGRGAEFGHEPLRPEGSKAVQEGAIGLFEGAVNVGGRGSLAMAELRKVAEGLGYGEVKTLLQSGNLVFDTRGKTDALERALEAALKQQLGIETTSWSVMPGHGARSSRRIRSPTRRNPIRAIWS